MQRDFDAQVAIGATDSTVTPSSAGTWTINGTVYSYSASTGGVPAICGSVSKSSGSCPSGTGGGGTGGGGAGGGGTGDPIKDGIGMSGSESNTYIDGSWGAGSSSDHWNNGNSEILVFDVTAGSYWFVPEALWSSGTPAGLTNRVISGNVATYTSTYGTSNGHTLKFAKLDGPFGRGDIVAMSW